MPWLMSPAKQRPGVIAMIKTIFAQETAQELRDAMER